VTKKEKTMRDIMGMMGKVKEMQAKILNGKGEMQSLKIDPSLFKEEDVEILEDLIVAAHKDAKDKAEAAAAEKTKALTAGLPIPPGFKMPF
jgi:DNA-binding protein YbaB